LDFEGITRTNIPIESRVTVHFDQRFERCFMLKLISGKGE
jgi:hypothetical protein